MVRHITMGTREATWLQGRPSRRRKFDSQFGRAFDTVRPFRCHGSDLVNLARFTSHNTSRACLTNPVAHHPELGTPLHPRRYPASNITSSTPNTHLTRRCLLSREAFSPPPRLGISVYLLAPVKPFRLSTHSSRKRAKKLKATKRSRIDLRKKTPVSVEAPYLGSS